MIRFPFAHMASFYAPFLIEARKKKFYKICCRIEKYIFIAAKLGDPEVRFIVTGLEKSILQEYDIVASLSLGEYEASFSGDILTVRIPDSLYKHHGGTI